MVALRGVHPAGLADLPAVRLRDEPVQIDSRHRSGEEKTLCPLTPDLLETDELLLSFDTFGRPTVRVKDHSTGRCTT